MSQRPLPATGGPSSRALLHLAHQLNGCSDELAALRAASDRQAHPVAVRARLKCLLGLIDAALHTARERASDADIGEPPDFGRSLALPAAPAAPPAGWRKAEWAQVSLLLQRAATILAVVDAMLQAEAPVAELVEEGVMQLHESVSAALEAVPHPAADDGLAFAVVATSDNA